MISETNLPTESFNEPVKFRWPELRGARIENPSAILPISLEKAVCLPEARLWVGSEIDRKLLSSSNWLLVDIEDKSRLVYADTSKFLNFDRFVKKIDPMLDENVLDISVVTENPRILVPREMAIQIGMSRLTDLGKVTQKNYLSTYTIFKHSQLTPSNNESCTLYQNNLAYQVQHDILSSSPQPNIANFHFAEPQLTRVRDVVKLPFTTVLAHKKLLLFLLVGRIIFGIICRRFFAF